MGSGVEDFVIAVSLGRDPARTAGIRLPPKNLGGFIAPGSAATGRLRPRARAEQDDFARVGDSGPPSRHRTLPLPLFEEAG